MANPHNLTCINNPLIRYAESNYQSSSIRPDGHNVTRHVQVLASEQEDFEQAMLGTTVFDGTQLLRLPPEPHPTKPWLLARSVEFVQNLSEPTTAGAGQLTYLADVELAVEYQWPEGGAQYLADLFRPAAHATDELWRFVSRRVEFEVTSQQIPKFGLSYAAAAGGTRGGKQVPSVGAAIVATSTLYYTWQAIPAVMVNATVPTLPGNLEATIASTVGTINLTTFDGVYPPYTLLCLAPKRKLVPQSDGGLLFELVYLFHQRGFKDVSGSSADSATPDHTRILNNSSSDATAYSRINRTGDETKFLYGTSEFLDLFKVA